jgi:predicted amidophosphoribosyltransferase
VGAGLLAPPRCLGCGALVAARLHERLCDACRVELAPGSLRAAPVEGVASTLAATAYRGPAVRIVAALKSGAKPAAAETMAELLAEALGPIPEHSVLVPVGPAKGRRLLRGLDPAEELALALARRLGLRVAHVLVRLDRRRQRGRGRELRLSDPPRFRVSGGAPSRAMLVDDVLTTGGTLRACAAALSVAGSRSVSALVFARTPSGRHAGWSEGESARPAPVRGWRA